MSAADPSGFACFCLNKQKPHKTKTELREAENRRWWSGLGGGLGGGLGIAGWRGPIRLEMAKFWGPTAQQGDGINHIILCPWKVLREQLSLSLFFFCLFRATPTACGGSQARGRIPGQPTPQPQQHQIPAASVTYTTAHGNAGSLTHWARPGIKPASSWILVTFVSAAPWRELPDVFFLLFPTHSLEGQHGPSATVSLHCPSLAAMHDLGENNI